MTNECKKRLRIIKYDGSVKHSQMAEKLLEKEIPFEKIADLAKIFKSSISSVHRFITNMNFPSFKHFKYEYQTHGEDQDVPTLHSENSKKVEEVVSRIRGKIWLVPSRRGRAIAKFTEERLLDAHLECEYYDEKNKNIGEFIEQIPKEDTIILVDISGHSYMISNTVEAIAKKKSSECPSVIILTAAKWLKMFEKHKFIHVAKFMSSHFEDITRWDDYNYIMIRLMPIVAELLNAIGKQKGVYM